MTDPWDRPIKFAFNVFAQTLSLRKQRQEEKITYIDITELSVCAEFADNRLRTAPNIAQILIPILFLNL